MGLLRSFDLPSVIAETGGNDAPFVFACDHAGREVPVDLARLGLPPDAFDRHIAWDIGAAAVTLQLTSSFNSPAFFQRYSRLVIDCNRDPTAITAIPLVSDGIVIPGNQSINCAARQSRIDEIHAPYHAAITAELDRRNARTLNPILIFMHSFTLCMGGLARPWHFGVIREPTSRFSQLVLDRLRANGSFEVGDNLPYAMDGTDYSAPTHALARGFDYLELEIRQDLVADSAGQQATACFLRDVLADALARI